MDEMTLTLNEYQRVNLLWMMEVAKELGILDSGEWFKQVLFKLSESGKLEPSDMPNMSVSGGKQVVIHKINTKWYKDEQTRNLP
jgi:hypothetical protein